MGRPNFELLLLAPPFDSDADHCRGLQILEHQCSRSRCNLKLHHIHLPINYCSTILDSVHTPTRTAAAVSSRYS